MDKRKWTMLFNNLMMDKKKCYIIGINALMIGFGIILLLNKQNTVLKNTYIIGVLVSLAWVVFAEKDNLLRPISYMIISFVIFLWARPLLSTFREVAIISVGNGVTNSNIVETLVYLGITQNTVILIAIIMEPMYQRIINLMNKERKFLFGKDIEIFVFGVAAFFLLLFLGDSIIKIPVIMEKNYLDISETILLQGYFLFRIGKLAILAWVIFGARKNRFEIATTLLLLASFGFLIRGARGYFISYFFLWLLFYAKNHRIRFIPLCLVAVGLILLANFILFYRMGWTSTTGIYETIASTLYAQGASIEPVFGTMHFTEEIAKLFPKVELLFRYDFGLFIDQARGVNFESGGFGDSFFAELYFLGLPTALIFLGALSFFTGLLEKAYHEAKKKLDFMNNFNLLLFMTMPNLIFFARGDIKDFIFKSLISIVFIVILTNVKKNSTEISILGLIKKK